MHIDDAIEEHVRDAFSAVIGHDGDGLKASLRQLDPHDLQVAFVYAVYVSGYVVHDVSEGETDDEGFRLMAQDTVDGTSSWIELGPAEAVSDFLKAAAAGDLDFPGVPTEDVAGFAFVVGGYLLSRYRRDGQRWFQYLDEIWNAAMSAESP